MTRSGVRSPSAPPFSRKVLDSYPTGRHSGIFRPSAASVPMRRRGSHVRAATCRWMGGRSAGQARQVKAERTDRKSVVEGKSVSVSVDIGGSRIIKKKNKKKR